MADGLVRVSDTYGWCSLLLLPPLLDVLIDQCIDNSVRLSFREGSAKGAIKKTLAIRAEDGEVHQLEDSATGTSQTLQDALSLST